MTQNSPHPDLDATYDFESDIEVDFDLSSEIAFDLEVENTVDVDVDIEGNQASFGIDVQAFGDDTSVDLNLVVAVKEDEWSSITATGYAAAGGNNPPANTPPTTVADIAYVELGDSVNADVAANDSDPDGTVDPTSLAITTPPLFGNAVANPDGTIDYIDTVADTGADDSVVDTVGYQIADDQAATSLGSLTVNVIDPLVETTIDTDTAGNGQNLSLTLTTEDRTANTTSFADVLIQAGDLQDSDVNVAFIFDSSGSVSALAYAEQLEAIQNAINQLRLDYALSPNSVTVDLINFSTGAAASGAIDLFDPSLDDIAALAITDYVGGSTNYTAPLALANDFFDAVDPGGSEDNFVLFVSDGFPNVGGDFTAEATELKAQASVTAVGFGAGINTATLDVVDNTGGSQVVANAEALGDVFADSPLFAATLVSFDLTLSVDGNPATLIADETDLTPLGGGDYTLSLASVGGLIGSDASVNTFTATAVFDTDGDLTTLADQVTLQTVNVVEGAVPDMFWV